MVMPDSQDSKKPSTNFLIPFAFCPEMSAGTLRFFNFFVSHVWCTIFL